MSITYKIQLILCISKFGYSVQAATWWLIYATKLFYLLLIETNLSSDDFQFRLWDFSPDCHNNLYRKSIYPIGMDVVEQMGIGVAIYCSKVNTVLNNIRNQSAPRGF